MLTLGLVEMLIVNVEDITHCVNVVICKIIRCNGC